MRRPAVRAGAGAVPAGCRGTRPESKRAFASASRPGLAVAEPRRGPGSEARRGATAEEPSESSQSSEPTHRLAGITSTATGRSGAARPGLGSAARRSPGGAAAPAAGAARPARPRRGAAGGRQPRASGAALAPVPARWRCAKGKGTAPGRAGPGRAERGRRDSPATATAREAARGSSAGCREGSRELSRAAASRSCPDYPGPSHRLLAGRRGPGPPRFEVAPRGPALRAQARGGRDGAAPSRRQVRGAPERRGLRETRGGRGDPGRREKRPRTAVRRSRCEQRGRLTGGAARGERGHGPARRRHCRPPLERRPMESKPCRGGGSVRLLCADFFVVVIWSGNFETGSAGLGELTVLTARCGRAESSRAALRVKREKEVPVSNQKPISYSEIGDARAEATGNNPPPPPFFFFGEIMATWKSYTEGKSICNLKQRKIYWEKHSKEGKHPVF